MKMNNYYNIDTNAHYFVPMRPLQRVLGLFSFTSSNDPEYFVECEVQPYDIEGINYKCYLVPVTEECKYNFGREEFYSCDFKSLLEMGRIIKKEHEGDHVENIRMAEHLCGNAYIIHEGECIVREVD